MDIKEFILNNIEGHPRDIVNLSIKKFRITRPAIHKHLAILIREGKVIAEGKTRNKKYSLPSSYKIHLSLPVTKTLNESDLWNEKIRPKTQSLPKNIYDLCVYGFTEIANNVIDHSEAKQLTLSCNFSGPKIILVIKDNGIGIFKKLQKAFNLNATREAILHLSKGKLTTDPEHHTGEGIFFTSRMFDLFSIGANGLFYARYQNQESDWLLDDGDVIQGTCVTMEIKKNSSRTAQDIFAQYGPSESNYTFSKTHVVVALGLIPGEEYISRSQAKRITMGLEKFTHVILDFKKVSTVGQGFVDEVFRVFQNSHPKIKLESVHMNDPVRFMIERSLPSSTP